jgi:hypothetical protein
MPTDPEQATKPCPWCGSTMKPEPKLTDGYKWGALACAECSATAPETRTGYGPPDTWYADALVEWNNRPAEAAQDVREVAALREELEHKTMAYAGGRFELRKALDAYAAAIRQAALDEAHNDRLDNLCEACGSDISACFNCGGPSDASIGG